MEAPTFFSTGVVSAKVLLQVASVATLTATSDFHVVHVLSCSTFMCFFGTHVITQDIMTGGLVGNDAKETKIQKVAKKRNPYKKAAWKSTSPGKKKQEPEVVALQNDTQECYLKSRLLLKKVIEWDATFTLWRKLSPYKMMTDFRVECGC